MVQKYGTGGGHDKINYVATYERFKNGGAGEEELREKKGRHT